MSAASDFLEAAVLDHLFRGQASPRQDTYWLALYTTATDDAGGGTEVSTGDWTNYARASVDASAASTIFNAATPSGNTHLVDNASAIDFGTATIVNPVDVTHWALKTASGAGNHVVHGALSTPQTINDGNPVSIPIGDLDITLA